MMPLSDKSFNKIQKNSKKIGDPDYKFIKDNFVRITQEEALSIRPELKINTSAALNRRIFFTCKQYNPVTKKCMDYKNRPVLCSGYPYYGNENKTPKEIAVHIDCGYLMAHPDGPAFREKELKIIKAIERIEEVCPSES